MTRLTCHTIILAIILTAIGVAFVVAGSCQEVAENFGTNGNTPSSITVHVTSNNGKITATWTPQHIFSTATVEIWQRGDKIADKDLNFLQRSYTFTSGIPGEVYDIRIMETGVEEGVTYERLFLTEDIIPNLPTIVIETSDGYDPTHDTVWAPTIGDVPMWGASVADNEYKEAVLYVIIATDAVTKKETTNKALSSDGNNRLRQNGGDIVSKVKIKVRGNTSSALSDKKSYKLKFKQPLNLFTDIDAPSKEWLLLNCGDNLKNYMGNMMATLCMTRPSIMTEFVNLYLNGDWKGIYVLSQPVKQSNFSDVITNDGFLFENDAYWWKDDEVYIKTARQLPQLGYTFKYPEFTSNDDSRALWLQKWLQGIEDFLYRDQNTPESSAEETEDDNSINDINEYKLSTYLDIKSFARWTLVRDILGQADGGGSNIYYYIKDSKENPQIHMGPLWDFDSAFYSGCDFQWSLVHEWHGVWTDRLWQYTRFREEYKEALKDLAENFDEKLDEWTRGLDIDALNHSRKLDATRWGRPYNEIDYDRLLEMNEQEHAAVYADHPITDVESEIVYYKKYLIRRIKWMNEEIDGGE